MEEEFFIVLQNDGSPYYDDDGNVLIQRHADGAQFYVSPQCINMQDCQAEMQTSNQQETVHHNPLAVNEEISNEQEESPTGETRHWRREQIIALINEYKINKRRFASTTIKHIKVWQDIACALGSHTGRQCENKFKYLRAMYLQKKDNMSNKSSGARNLHFDYFTEMDDIFSKEPIVKPLAIASSSREYPLETPSETADSNSPVDSNPQIDSTESNSDNPAPRARRTIKLKDALNELNKILKDAEADKERRHTELLQLQKYNIDKFTEFMSKILEKM